MGDLEYSLKEIIDDLRSTVKELERTVNLMNSTLGNDYQKKTDCEKCRNELNARINTANGWIFGVYGLIIASVAVVIALK